MRLIQLSARYVFLLLLAVLATVPVLTAETNSSGQSSSGPSSSGQSNANDSEPNTVEEISISGQLNFVEVGMACDDVPVGLEQSYGTEIRQVKTDLLCGFSFRNVAPGLYYLHVAVPGYEEVHQPARVLEQHVNSRTIISMNRIAGYSHSSDDSNHQSSDDIVLDISELPSQYPKEAVRLYEESVKSRKKGKAEQAARELEMALSIAPEFYAAHNDLGIVYDTLGRFDDAAIHFWKAHDINSTKAAPLINLSALLLERGEYEEAERVAKLAVDIDPLSAQGFFNLGMARYRRSENELAEKSFLTALHLAPALLETRFALANVYGKLGRLDSLLEQLDFYIEKAPAGIQRSQAEQLREKVLNIINQQSGSQ